jgi:hypothetical protein
MSIPDIIVEAAMVDWAYVEGAYVEVPVRPSRVVDTDSLAEWPKKGRLGFRLTGLLIDPLRLDRESK